MVNLDIDIAALPRPSVSRPTALKVTGSSTEVPSPSTAKPASAPATPGLSTTSAIPAVPTTPPARNSAVSP